MWNRFETAPERYRRQTSCSWHIANRLYRRLAKNRITLFVRLFEVYHVCGTFAGGSRRTYITFKEFSINTGSNSSHHHLLLQWIWTHGIRNFFCNLLRFKDKRLYSMHKLHLCCWEGEGEGEGEGIEDNLDLSGFVLGFLLKEDLNLAIITD